MNVEQFYQILENNPVQLKRENSFRDLLNLLSELKYSESANDLVFTMIKNKGDISIKLTHLPEIQHQPLIQGVLSLGYEIFHMWFRTTPGYNGSMGKAEALKKYAKSEVTSFHLSV